MLNYLKEFMLLYAIRILNHISGIHALDLSTYTVDNYALDVFIDDIYRTSMGLPLAACVLRVELPRETLNNSSVRQ